MCGGWFWKEEKTCQRQKEKYLFTHEITPSLCCWSGRARIGLKPETRDRGYWITTYRENEESFIWGEERSNARLVGPVMLAKLYASRNFC